MSRIFTAIFAIVALLLSGCTTDAQNKMTAMSESFEVANAGYEECFERVMAECANSSIAEPICEPVKDESIPLGSLPAYLTDPQKADFAANTMEADRCLAEWAEVMQGHDARFPLWAEVTSASYGSTRKKLINDEITIAEYHRLRREDSRKSGAILTEYTTAINRELGVAHDREVLRRQQTAAIIGTAILIGAAAAAASSGDSGYSGNCPCPYSIDAAGNRCGARSAYSRSGGASPKCY